jgi:two-component system sensor histidine kinase UhpB
VLAHDVGRTREADASTMSDPMQTRTQGSRVSSGEPLRVLLVEDDADDLELILYELRKAGFDPEWWRVETEVELRERLDPRLDVIVSDHRLPTLDSFRVLELVRDLGVDVPVIVVSGVIGEDTAVEAMRAGAFDYVHKDRIARLGVAVGNAREARALRQAHERMRRLLEESERRYRDVFDNSVAGIFRSTVEGELEVVNDAAARILGYGSAAELLASGLSATDIFADPTARERLLAQLDQYGEVRGFETWFRTRRGELCWVSEDIRGVRDEDGRLVHLVGTFVDRTERKRAEAEYRTLVEQVPGIVYAAEVGRDKPFYYVSPKIERVLGYTPDEWLADPTLWAARVHPEDLERTLAASERSRLTGEQFEADYRMIARDGRTVWIRDEAEFVHDEHLDRRILRGLMQDVTDRALAEQARLETLQRLTKAAADRRRLLAKLVSAQETERARIAQDIHDDPIQVMTAVRLRLETLSDRCEDPEITEAVRGLADAVGGSIERLRRLMFELMPTALDQDGLTAALRIVCEQIRAHAGIEYALEDRLDAEPPAELRAVLFRAAREALVNARKHSGARVIEIEIARRDGGFGVRIRDDGRGFVVAQANDPMHMGLLSMREQMESAGGSLQIVGTPGEGTVVDLYLPEGLD